MSKKKKRIRLYLPLSLAWIGIDGVPDCLVGDLLSAVRWFDINCAEDPLYGVMGTTLAVRPKVKDLFAEVITWWCSTKHRRVQVEQQDNVADVAEIYIKLPSNEKTNQGYNDVYENACGRFSRYAARERAQYSSASFQGYRWINTMLFNVFQSITWS